MSLKQDFITLFDNMREHPVQYNDEQFYTSISNTIRDYVATLHVTATVSGSDAGPSGTFTGSVSSSSLSISGSTIKAKLKAACDRGTSMTDADLAKAFADGMDQDTVSFSITIQGTTVTSDGPKPSSDSGSVTVIFNKSLVQSDLLQTFNDMKRDPTQYTDTSFAETLADAITTFYTQPTSCVVSGATHLSGSSGSGTIA